MACRNCGSADTIRAHLVPEAFVREVKGERGEQLLIVHPGQARPQVSNTGAYDPDLLCGPCDGLLGRYEGYAFSLFQRFRAIQAPLGTFIDTGPIDGDLLVRFAAGIAWKYTATRPQFGRIDIGPYADRVKEVAFGSGPIPASLDLAMIRIVELDGEVYFYRAPVPARHDGINSVRFSVGSFVLYLKTDKRPLDKLLPPECWLKGREQGKFLIADASHFEEAKLHRRLAATAPVQKFFDKMRSRKISRDRSGRG